MRKQTKLVAVLSAAALLAIGASMTSFAAAAHWDQQDGEWVYLDRNGDRMTDVWRKSNGQWYYLDSDGYMAREQVIEDDDDKYYVDANGVRVTNTWVSLDNDDLLDDEDEPESIDTVWMYFDANGKALGAGSGEGEIKRVAYGDGQSGYFIFDDEGYMQSGWKRWSRSTGFDEGDLYYLGSQDEGWARTNWQWLEVNTDLSVFDGVETEDANYQDEAWFFFRQNGKAYVDGTASYNNRTYAFDSFGRMLDLWVYPSVDTELSSASNYTNVASSSSTKAAYYTETDGGRVGTEWILAYPNSNYDDYDEDLYYFYLDAKGRPFRADQGAIDNGRLTAIGSAYRVDDDNPDAGSADDCREVGARAIQGHTYLFNNHGVMLTGLYYLGGDEGDNGSLDTNGTEVYKGTSALEKGYYYFTEDDYPSSVAGQMVTNKRITIDVDGDDETYYFNKAGKAYESTIINDYVYGRDGKLVTSRGDGNTYQVVTLQEAGAVEEGDGSWVLYDKDGETPKVTGGNNVRVLINEKGKIKRSGSVKDINGSTVKVSDYTVDSIETD